MYICICICVQTNTRIDQHYDSYIELEPINSSQTQSAYWQQSGDCIGRGNHCYNVHAYMYMYMCRQTGTIRIMLSLSLNSAQAQSPQRRQRLAFTQDIILFRCFCARINHPFIFRAHLHCPPWCNTIARLLGSIRSPLRPPVCMLYTINIGNTNIV